jgi:hypothetical protein
MGAPNKMTEHVSTNEAGMASANRATVWQSPIPASSGEEMFSKAIALTLESPPGKRLELFERFLQEIVTVVSANPEMRPWKYDRHVGTDGSRIFSGGVGLSLVIDPEGRLWRGRTYEDFETTHTISGTSCEVESMTPKYDQMREYERL